MTIRHLEYFIKVCETGSISKAAEELCVAQPSVSQTIKEIEQYYNVVLFIRDKRNIVLTKEGKELLVKARDIISCFEQFEDTAKRITEYPKVRIGASLTYSIKLLPLLIQYLKEKIPNLDYYVKVANGQILEDKIIKGELDFALTEGLTSNKVIFSDDFASDKLLCIAGNNYNIPDKIKLEDLVKYDLCVCEPNSNPRKLLDYALALKGKKYTPRMESSCNTPIMKMVIANQGVAVLPRGVCQSSIDEGKVRLIELDYEFNRPLHIIYHKNKNFTKAVKKAISLSKEFILK